MTFEDDKCHCAQERREGSSGSASQERREGSSGGASELRHRLQQVRGGGGERREGSSGSTSELRNRLQEVPSVDLCLFTRRCKPRACSCSSEEN